MSGEVDVELSGLRLIGDKSEEDAGVDIAPSAPRVRARVFGLIGDVKVVRR